MDRLLPMPMLWAQSSADDFEIPLLALRRWFWGQTLSSPRAAPGSEGLAAWMLGLLVLLLLVVVLQGPGRAFRQLFDLPGHIRLMMSAVERLRASARLVMIVLGSAVLCWTTALLFRYKRPSGLADLTVLLRSKSVSEASVDQGILVALTPLRDLFSLADLLVLLAIATFVAFRFSADHWGEGDEGSVDRRLPRWATLAWASTALYGLYRLVVMLGTSGDLPMGGCLFVEPIVVPILMLISDGVLLSWVLVELKRSDRSSDVEPLPTTAILSILPAAMFASFLAIPARYVAVSAYLVLMYVPDVIAGTVLAPLLSGWGLVFLQGAAVLLVGLVGAVPWCRGGVRSALSGYGTLLREEGGHLVATLAIGGLLAAIPTSLAYLLVLSLPPQPWVLPAADSYTHYVTLVIGLGLMAALVELGSRAVALPEPSTLKTSTSEALATVD